MIVHVSNIAVGINKDQETAKEMAMKTLGVKQSDVLECFVAKSSVDARKRMDIKMIYTIGVKLQDGTKISEQQNVRVVVKTPPHFAQGDTPLLQPPVIVGFGPAGMFCGLYLARLGFRPVILERGSCMEERIKSVENFQRTGKLDTTSNVQFGEGGAGTFSDGKLTTRINDPLCDAVLGDLVKMGAPEEIAQVAKPHIGTDKLRPVVVNIRNEIERLGGQVLFNTTLVDINRKNGKITSVVTDSGEIPTEVVVLATGHSARDTFRNLYASGIAMESKAFSVGARLEHLQSEVDKALYGEFAGHPLLPKGEYHLSWRDAANDRAAYTFCMCPGGVVVPATSIEGGVVTNGMSYHNRAGKNANSALVVSVDKRDFGNGVLDGIVFQEKIEQSAYKLTGGYMAPAQTVGSFLGGKYPLKQNPVTPTYANGVKECAISQLFPPVVNEYMKKGLAVMGRKQKGFDAPTAVLTAPETRTSSPVRILRDREKCCSADIVGFYPCGEGSGYAGGIMSAAVDGIRIAQRICEVYSAK